MKSNARGHDPNAIRRQHAAALREGKRVINESDRRGRAAAREAEKNEPGPDVERALRGTTIER